MASSLHRPRFAPPTVSRRVAPYLFISPFFILFAIFTVFPTFYGLFISFTKTRITDLNTMTWNGLENYSFNLTDPMFWKAITNTLILGGYGLMIQPIAVVLAFTIHMGLKRFKGAITTMYFLPYITSSVAVSIVFSMVFSERVGVVNVFLAWLHQFPILNLITPAQNINWLGEPVWIKPVIAVVVLWKWLGWNVLLYLARIQSIPQELYEAAKVDGATTAQQFWYVTIPQLTGTIFFNLTLTIIGQMNLFDEPYTLLGTGGGSDNAGLTIGVYLYKTMIEFKEAGTASAMGWILFAFVIVMTALNNRIFGESGRARGD